MTFDPTIGLGSAILLRDAGGNWGRAAAHCNAGRFARGAVGAGYAPPVIARAGRVS